MSSVSEYVVFVGVFEDCAQKIVTWVRFPSPAPALRQATKTTPLYSEGEVTLPPSAWRRRFRSAVFQRGNRGRPLLPKNRRWIWSGGTWFIRGPAAIRWAKASRWCLFRNLSPPNRIIMLYRLQPIGNPYPAGSRTLRPAGKPAATGTPVLWLRPTDSSVPPTNQI